MGLIETVVCDQYDMTVHSIHGDVNGDDIIEKIKQGLEEKHTRFVIWDFTQAEVNDLPMEKMHQILTIGKKLAEVRKGGKTAIVTTNDLGFGLARMYEAYSEIELFPTQNRAFRTIEQALEWLGVTTMNTVPC